MNTNHDFGGWRGIGLIGQPIRPLNSYVDLPLEIDNEEGAKAFRCPADAGGILGIPPDELAYSYFGNSYQTNIILVGPTQLGLAATGLQNLHNAINRETGETLKLGQITISFSRVALMGDNNWIHEWNPLEWMPPIIQHSKAWHGKEQHHNVAFIDGRVEFLKIRKGIYVSPEYTIVPFKGPLKMAKEIQVEIE
jgi:hypothetical protein